MAWFGAAYSRDDPGYYNYSNRSEYFGNSDTQAAQNLSNALSGGQVDPNQVGQQTTANAQGNAIGLANTQRGGRGNAMMRSAMLQAPQAQQAGAQAAYGQQQANYQQASAAQDFEAQRRAAVEGRELGQQAANNEQALAQQRDTNNQIAAVGGIMKAVSGGAAMSDERVKNVLGGKQSGGQSPAVIIMIGHGEHEHGGMGLDDEEDEEPDAGSDAVEAMRQLEPSTFEYKPEFKGAPGAGEGEYTGIMAQDLERTPAGAGTVTRGPDGMRRVDGAKLATLNSAALSKVVKDVDKLKGGKRA